MPESMGENAVHHDGRRIRDGMIPHLGVCELEGEFVPVSTLAFTYFFNELSYLLHAIFKA
jgi:hypothetical protein